MSTIKVYGAAFSTCTARVLAALEETGAEYELVPINFIASEHKQPAHLSRNPFGQVPALEDGDLTLFESRAISKYIARKFKGQGTNLLHEDSLSESATVEVWTEVESQQFHPAIYPIVFEYLIGPKFFGKPSDENVIASSAEKLGKVLDIYEARLSKTKYLAGDFFSLADLHHLPYTHYLMTTPQKSLFESRPHAKAWWEDMSSRPAIKKVRESMSFSE